MRLEEALIANIGSTPLETIDSTSKMQGQGFTLKIVSSAFCKVDKWVVSVLYLSGNNLSIYVVLLFVFPSSYTKIEGTWLGLANLKSWKAKPALPVISPGVKAVEFFSVTI